MLNLKPKSETKGLRGATNNETADVAASSIQYLNPSSSSLNEKTKKKIMFMDADGGLSCCIKRLSTQELEEMIQSQLRNVIDKHHYNSWLVEQVEETDAQLIKYKNRIEVLQKHVNDLSTVIQKHVKNSDDSPPIKLTRNVGLQVNNKENIKGSELCPGGRKAHSAEVDSEKLTPTPKDFPEPIKEKEEKLDGVGGSSSCVSLDKKSIEIEPDSDDSNSSKKRKDLVTTTDKPKIADCKKSPSGFPGSFRLLTPPTFIPQMDAASNFVLSSTSRSPSDAIIPSVQPTCIAERIRPSVIRYPSNKSLELIGMTRNPPQLVSLNPSPSAGDHPKNATSDCYSKVDRKRRLPCSIKSFDASTIASVEKHNKLIKESWYSQAPQPSAEVQNNDRMTNHQQVITPSPDWQMNRLPIVPKPIPQREFEKKVQSIGVYHKWKLPPPLIRQSVINYPSPNHQQQFPNIRTWIPRSNYFDFPLSPTRHEEDAQMLNGAFSVVVKQPHSSVTNPSKIHCNPAQSLKSKKNLPDLIAISIKVDDCVPNRGVSPSLFAEWTNDSITNVKPILMLTRCEKGIRLEWTIRKLKQVDQIASYVLHARKEKKLTPSAESSWLQVADFTSFPLPMSYKFTELTPDCRYYFRIGATLRGNAQDIIFSEAASVMM